MVRVASSVDQLDRNVRLHGLQITQKGMNDNEIGEVPSSDSKPGKAEMFSIGTKLVEFMVLRGIISLSSEKSAAVKVKKGSYYMESTSYVICNFELSLLPIKFNIPMVKEISNYIAPEVTRWQAESSMIIAIIIYDYSCII
ncbi:hypothetical protein L1887_20191 [Cichorium endivia]|nr:hypothetical protein L1887_20191 [Cichorium endivia]